MTTVEEALTRLKIVKEATKDFDSPLAGVEAVTAVQAFLVAVLEDTDDLTIRTLAANAIVMGGVMPLLDDEHAFRLTFSVFAQTVELLLEIHE